MSLKGDIPNFSFSHKECLVIGKERRIVHFYEIFMGKKINNYIVYRKLQKRYFIFCQDCDSYKSTKVLKIKGLYFMLCKKCFNKCQEQK